MFGAGWLLKSTRPCTFDLPAAGFSFSVPVPEWMTPLSSGLPAAEEVLAVWEVPVSACFVDLQAISAQITKAKMQTRLEWFFIFPLGIAWFCFSNPLAAVCATKTIQIGAEPVFSHDDAAALLSLDAALIKLAAFDERKARVLEMRAFGGMTAADTALALGISEPTVKRDMRMAQAWLRRELESQ